MSKATVVAPTDQAAPIHLPELARERLAAPLAKHVRIGLVIRPPFRATSRPRD